MTSYPICTLPETVRVAMHVIHKNTTSDTTNLPNGTFTDDFFEEFTDSINLVLANLGNRNYFTHTNYNIKDAKFRVELYAVHHHADDSLFDGLYHDNSIINRNLHNSALKTNLITNNSAISTYEKEHVLPVFYYGDPTVLGGRVFAIPTREGLAFTGILECFTKWFIEDELRYDYVGNFIHEISHALGLYHNFTYQTIDNGIEVTKSRYKSGCDYVLPQSPATKWIFGDSNYSYAWNPYLPNNFMYKNESNISPPNWAPGPNSFSYCQVQRMIWKGWNFDNYSYNSPSNINQCLTFFQPCNNTFNAEVEGSHVLDYDFTAYGNIIIKSGASLTVTCELQMPEDAKIIVEPGGKLIVDGGTILNSCGSFWGGIEVRSNSVHSQLDAFLDINYNNLGFVHIKNSSIIKNATIGVLRKTQVTGANSYKGGGIVKIENSDFINNPISVYMEPFQGAYPGTYRKLKDLLYFKHQLYYH